MAKKLAEQIYEIAFNAIPHLTPLEEKWKVMNSVPAAIVNNV